MKTGTGLCDARFLINPPNEPDHTREATPLQFSGTKVQYHFDNFPHALVKYGRRVFHLPVIFFVKKIFRAELAVADEDDTCIDISRAYAGDPDTEEEEEYLALLANQEPHRGFNANDTLVIDSWFRNARLEAITWILRTRKTFGFHFHTAYLSMIYFDRFISSRSIDRRHSWVVKLISVACISLASKMEEDSPPRETISRTVRYILALMKERHSMSHRPSVIAAAASLVVINNSLTRATLETQMNSVAYPGFLNVEDVFRCYSLLQQLDVENLRSPANVSSASRSSSVNDIKRRRLTFDDPDKN
ncbi:CYCLINS [Salix viminalis]|uniref:B-like cyclin n=1 Tax=Salix viminalis TaxID=40686 RepID=A0A9Q0UHU6_SALVM|nr:CYCLINS [Salix viminalis]